MRRKLHSTFSVSHHKRSLGSARGGPIKARLRWCGSLALLGASFGTACGSDDPSISGRFAQQGTSGAASTAGASPAENTTLGAANDSTGTVSAGDTTDMATAVGTEPVAADDDTISSTTDVAVGGAMTASTTDGTGDDVSVVAVGDDAADDVSLADDVQSGNAGKLIAPRIRRLTTREIARSLEALFPAVVVDSERFVPDARQGVYNGHGGYARNAAQVVDPVFARQLQELATEVAAKVAADAAALPTCASGGGDAACAEEILEELLPRIYRRPLAAGELAAVMSLFELGAETDFTSGLELALSSVLQSASFLYHSEIGGDAAPSADVTLSAYEIADQLAYFLTGAPPDEELSQLAAAGDLFDADVRVAQARRLLAGDGARPQVQTMIKEWLAINTIERTAKSSEAFPDVDFDEIRTLMAEESNAFIDEVVFEGDGTVATLLGADFTMVSRELGDFYGLDSQGIDERTSLAGSLRVGILTQGSFLATHASEVDSAPVQRGNAVLRQVLCRQTPDPSTVDLDVDVTFPAADDASTTRERFEQHLTIEPCRQCHAAMDPIGFSFEGFDATGRERDTENGNPIDASGVFPAVVSELGEIAFTDSQQLLSAFSDTDTAARCFARNAARFASARTAPDTENAFLGVFDAMDATARNNIIEILVAYAGSDVFVHRVAEEVSP